MTVLQALCETEIPAFSKNICLTFYFDISFSKLAKTFVHSMH